MSWQSSLLLRMVCVIVLFTAADAAPTVLCNSWDEFENYHVTVAMWSMVGSLGPKEKQELFKRVLDKSASSLGYTCNEWREFIKYLTASVNH